MDTFTLIIILLIVLVVIGMVAAVMISNQTARKERALAVIKGQAQAESSNESERSAQDKRREQIAQKLKEASEGEEKSKKKVSMRSKLLQAGLKTSVKKFYIFSFLFSIVFTGIMFVLHVPKVSLPLLWFFGFIGLPRMFISRRIKKRQKQFLEEFGDALEAMVRLLKAGMPVTEAIAMAGREFEGPVGEEMLMIYDAQKIGVPLPEATLEAAERMPITEMQMFATGIAIQTQTGASLSEVLMNLAGVIRARFKLKRKVQALSAEAKASAGIIGSLPFLVGGGMYLINNEYILMLFTTTPGKIMMMGSAFWMSLGIFIMKAMINFKV